MSSVSSEIHEYINQELDRIEKDFNVKILYACESGSRAWGISNSESDYDIRFIYVRPEEEYIRLSPLRDVIDDKDLKHYTYDYPLDFSGWDLNKTFLLHYQSNPTLREYIESDIVYRGDTSFLEDLPDFNPITLMHHYASMTRNNWNKYVTGKDYCLDKRYIKTYCYCIRQILAWMYIYRTGLTDSSINIYELINSLKEHKIVLQEEYYNDIMSLISFYQSSCQDDFDRDILKRLTEFIEYYIPFMNDNGDDVNRANLPVKSMDFYNEHYRKVLYQTASDDFFNDGSWLRCNFCYNQDGTRVFGREVDTWCKLHHPEGLDSRVYCEDYMYE